MWIRKIKAYKIVCSHCGTEITISQDEYMKYRKEMEGYSGATVVCQKETEDGKNVVYLSNSGSGEPQIPSGTI